MIKVSILADSINPLKTRITTWLLTYPRFIHSEFMTHRVFSRNASSSRAIPLNKMLGNIQSCPALPEKWGAEQKGMQSGDQLSPENIADIHNWWIFARNECVNVARNIAGRNLHKSLCNRLIEPWSHITVVATTTYHDNFFSLRAHPDAMPEFQVLAYKMLAQYLFHTPTELYWGQWHIPQFEGTPEEEMFPDETKRLQVATARCARTSYLTFDGNFSIEKDVELHDRLAKSGHWSPFEHCAQAVDFRHPGEFRSYPWSNFDVPPAISGWGQYRKLFYNENRRKVDLVAVLSDMPDWVREKVQ